MAKDSENTSENAGKKRIGLFAVNAPDGDKEYILEEGKSLTFGYANCDINFPYDMLKKLKFKISEIEGKYYLESFGKPVTVDKKNIRVGYLENEAFIDLGVVEIRFYRQFETVSTEKVEKATVCPICKNEITEEDLENVQDIQGANVHQSCYEKYQIKKIAKSLEHFSIRVKESKINVLERIELRAIASIKGHRKKIDVTQYTKWTHAPKNVAQIQENPPRLVGFEQGKVIVTAMFENFQAKKEFRVTDSPLKVLELFSSSQEVPIGETVTIRAFGLYEDNSRRDITYLVNWFHEPETFLRPIQEKPHVFKTFKEGVVSVSAQYQNVESNAMEISIKPPCPKELLLSYPATTLSLGRRDKVDVVCLYSDGLERPNQARVHWQTFPRNRLKIEETPEGIFFHPIKAGNVQVKAHTLTLSSKFIHLKIGLAKIKSGTLVLPNRLVVGQVYRPILRIAYDNGMTSEIYEGFDFKVNRPGAIKFEDSKIIPVFPGQVQLRFNYESLDIVHKVTINSPEKSSSFHGNLLKLRLELSAYNLSKGEECTYALLGEYADGAVLELGQQVLVKVLNGPIEVDRKKRAVKMTGEGPATIWAGLQEFEAMATVNASEISQESSEDISTISTYKDMEIPEPAEGEEDESEGLRIGPYTILKLINEGGMGKIFLGKKDNSPTLYAIKVMSDAFSNTQKKLENFRREAKVAMMLNHPNIVRVFEFSEKANLAFIAMEHVDGADLATIIHRLGRLEFREAIKIIRQVAMALEYAHQKGIVHRDIKPANILVTRQWQAKLLDFGLNRIMDGHEEENKENSKSSGVVIKASLGTPNFMAPEQIIDAETVDGRADLYSLGATFYNCLTGKAPWEGKANSVVMENQVKKSLPPLSKEIESLPPEINNLFAKLMAKKADKRYKSARDFLVDLLELEMSGSQG